VISSLLAWLLLLPAPAAAAPPPLRLGLLESGGLYGGAVSEGAREAVREINALGGVRGRKLALHSLPETDDPWMDGAPRIAQLAYEKKLTVLLGPTDRSLAHLAGQIATKLRIPLLALSGGRLLTRVYDPWLFRGIPEDSAQAQALLRWADPRVSSKRAVAVIPGGRDGAERLEALREACAGSGFELAGILKGTEAPVQIRGGVILLWLDPAPAHEFIRRNQRASEENLVLGSLRLAVPGPESAAIVLPDLAWKDLGYDLVRSLADAAEEEGTAPEDIRRGLLAGRRVRGRSGEFIFDANGNREGAVPVTVRSGVSPRLKTR